MRKMKKIIPLTMAFATILCLASCGNANRPVNAGGEENIEKEIPESMDASNMADMLESGMTVDQVIDRVEGVKSGESATTDKPAETASPTQTEKPTATPSPTQTPEPTVAPEPTPTPHVHVYKVESSTEATCSTEGKVVKVCECGEKQTESVPATGNHNWEPVYQTLNHPSVGHVEQRETQVQVGMSEMRHEYECGYCGFRADTPSGVVDHQAVQFEDGLAHAGANTIIYDYPGSPIYETQMEAVWVVDTPEYTTQELVGYACPCGATK